MPAALDGEGTHLDDGTRTDKGEEVGPVIKTTPSDFIIARYNSDFPIPKVVADPWQYRTSYVYIHNAPAGTYQPMLSGGEGKSGKFCMSAAAFKAAPGASRLRPARQRRQPPRRQPSRTSVVRRTDRPLYFKSHGSFSALSADVLCELCGQTLCFPAPSQALAGCGKTRIRIRGIAFQIRIRVSL